MHPLVLRVEGNLLGRLARLGSTLAAAFAEMEQAMAEARGLTAAAQRHETEVEAAREAAARGGGHDAKQHVMELYVRRLELAAITVAITVRIQQSVDERASEYALSHRELAAL